MQGSARGGYMRGQPEAFSVGDLQAQLDMETTSPEPREAARGRDGQYVQGTLSPPRSDRYSAARPIPMSEQSSRPSSSMQGHTLLSPSVSPLPHPGGSYQSYRTDSGAVSPHSTSPASWSNEKSHPPLPDARNPSPSPPRHDRHFGLHSAHELAQQLVRSATTDRKKRYQRPRTSETAGSPSGRSLPPPPPQHNVWLSRSNSNPPSIKAPDRIRYGYSAADEDVSYDFDSTASSDSEGPARDAGTAFSPRMGTPDEMYSPDDLPDATRANRRPPHYTPARIIQAKSGIACACIHRSVAVAARHDKLRVYSRARDGDWDERTYHLDQVIERKDLKIDVMAFKPMTAQGSAALTGEEDLERAPSQDGRYVWCGTRDGDLFEFDSLEGSVTAFRSKIHTAGVVLLRSVAQNMISVDASGKICVWQPKVVPGTDAVPRLSVKESAITFRVTMDKNDCPMILGDELWIASAVESSHLRTPKIRVFRPFAEDKPFNAVSRPVTIPASKDIASVGAVTCGTLVHSEPGLVYLGHKSGHISIWSRSTYSCIRVQTLSSAGVVSLLGLRESLLWTGDRKGKIYIYDVSFRPWRIVKMWAAHDGQPVTNLASDSASILYGALPVLSTSLEGNLHIWDGLLTSDWMTGALQSRVREYSTLRQLSTLHLTFNINAVASSESERQVYPALSSFTQAISENKPEVLVVGFQEVVDLEDKGMMAKKLIFGGGRRNKQDVGERVSHQARAWAQSLASDLARLTTESGTEPFRLLLQDTLVGLYMAIFVRESESVNVREASIASVKTGLGGRIGNKGGIVASLLFDDTSIAFVNCHLAAGQRHIQQRNADLVDIFESYHFGERAARIKRQQTYSGASADFPTDLFAGGGDGAMILPDHEIVFVGGDFNYRIDLRRDQCLNLIDRSDINGLLAHDQLRREMSGNPAHRLRLFSEGSINFLPTYKFDPNSDVYDTSDKSRVPSYCDRIVWFARNDVFPTANASPFTAMQGRVERDGPSPDLRGNDKDASSSAFSVRCLGYWRGEVPSPSDHRPVMARFSVHVRRDDVERRRAIIIELQDEWKRRQAAVLKAAEAFYSS